MPSEQRQGGGSLPGLRCENSPRTRTHQNPNSPELRIPELTCVLAEFWAPAFCCVLGSAAFWQNSKSCVLRSGSLRSAAFWDPAFCCVLGSAAFAFCCVLRSAAFAFCCVREPLAVQPMAPSRVRQPFEMASCPDQLRWHPQSQLLTRVLWEGGWRADGELTD